MEMAGPSEDTIDVVYFVSIFIKFNWSLLGKTTSVLPASVFKKQKYFLCFFLMVVFFCCGKVFLSAFFLKMCFFPDDMSSENKVYSLLS